MNLELAYIIDQLNETYSGSPWYGSNITQLLSAVDDSITSERPNNQHSLLELLWHVITWREFTIAALNKSDAETIEQIRAKDWRELDQFDKTIWQQGLQRLQQTQDELLHIVQQQNDELLNQIAFRDFTFRTLLNGIIQHDIYHIGQVAYVTKFLRSKSD